MNGLELVNLCTQPFIARAESSCVEADEHSINNLYSLDPAATKKGFRVERFIRPPMHLTFSFKVPVKVVWVVVSPELSEGERCKIQVAVGPATGISTSLALKHCGQFVLDSCQGPLVLQHRCYPGSEVPGMVLGSQLLPTLNQPQHQLSRHSLRSFPCLSHSTSIVVSLLHWTGHRAASLASVEVWGSVSPSATINQLSLYETCKQALQKAVIERRQQLTSPLLYQTSCARSSSCVSSGLQLGPSCVSASELHGEVNKHHGPNSLTPVVTGACHKVDPTHQCCYPNQLGSSTAATTASTSKSDSLAQYDSIQPHFLDELTLEIMSIPMLLPSGHMVDRSTLDKTQEADLAYGRSPTDPFTGVPFSNRQQPKFCPHLKTQIDQFLSDHEATDNGRGHTVGSAIEISAHLQQSYRIALGTIDQHATDPSSSKVSKKASPKVRNDGEYEENFQVGILYNHVAVLFL